MSKQRRKRKPRRTVFEVKIRQGVCHITANNEDHAKRQALSLQRDMSRDRHGIVRNQTMMEPGVFVLGWEAKRIWLAAQVAA